LLEAMQEHQVTIGENTYPLPNPFWCWHQNPLEHEGTYPLPEAQIDRFMMKVVIAIPIASKNAHLGRHGDDRAITRRATRCVQRAILKRGTLST